MKNLKLCLLFFSCLLLTGCWDQQNLKDVKLIMAAGFDLTSDGKIFNTVAIPLFTSTAGQSESTESQIASTVGDTPRDSRNNINNKISEEFDASKLMVILLGEEYAKQDISSTMDIFYRDPKSNHVANMAIVKGQASDVLRIKTQEKKPVHQYLDDLIRSKQDDTVIPKQAPNPIISYMFNPGTDFVLPLMEAKENEAEIIGLGMFNKNKYTGQDLTPQESTLFLLMSDQKRKKAWLKFKVHENKEPEMNNYILINVTKSKRDLKIIADDPDDISVDLTLNFKIDVMEYPEDHLNSNKKIDDLKILLSEHITKEVNNVILKTQKANSDILGIGRHFIAFHHDTWKKIDWEKQYPNLNFKAKVNVEIVKHGITN